MEWLAHAVVSNALVATLIALLAASASLARRPALTHGLWLLVLIKLVTPPIATVALLPAKPAVAPSASPADPVSAGAQVASGEPVDILALEVLPVDQHPGIVPAEPAVQTRPHPGQFPWLVAAWGTGALTWWATAARRIVRFARVLRAARPADEALQSEIEALARRLGLNRGPRALLVPGTVPPLIWSIGGAPRLVLPEALWADLESDAREALLTHELAHLRRRDHWTRWLELLIGGLYWWHPVVWWARRALRSAEEQCCDAWVVAARPEMARTYARALLATLDFLSEPRVSTPLAASGIGHVSCLKRRMTMIVRAETPKALSWRGRLAVLALGATLLPLTPTWAQRDEPRNETTPAPEGQASDEKPRDAAPAPSSRERSLEKYRRTLEERLGVMDERVKKQLDEAFSQMEKAFQAGKINEDELRRNLERTKREVGEAMERARLAQRERRGEADANRRSEPAGSPERRDQIEKARAEVHALHDKLRQAEDRLAELEGRPRPRYRIYHDIQTSIEERPAAKGAGRVREAVPKREESRPRDSDRLPDAHAREERPRDMVRFFTPAPPVPEQRVRQLEERLDSLMKEMQQLKNELRSEVARPSTDPPKAR